MSSHLQTLIQSLTNFKDAILGRIRTIEDDISSLDYAPSTHNQPVSTISDSTPIGRALVTASTESVGRDTIKAEKALGGPVSISSNANLATNHVGETLILQNNAVLTLPTAVAAWVGKYVSIWTPATGGTVSPSADVTLSWHVGGEIQTGARAIAPGSTVTLYIESASSYRIAGNGM